MHCAYYISSVIICICTINKDYVIYIKLIDSSVHTTQLSSCYNYFVLSYTARTCTHTSGSKKTAFKKAKKTFLLYPIVIPCIHLDFS